MCKYIESTHTYELCKLQDENHDGSPNPLAGFFGRITSALSNAPGEDVAPMANRRDLHVVKEKTIIQCIAVRKDPNQQGKHVDERRCADPTALNATPVTVAETEHRGVCPVCQAGEEAITEALSRDIVVSENVSQVGVLLICCRFQSIVDLNRDLARGGM